MNLIPILLVEDDENDVLFVRHAFRQAQIHNSLSVVESADDALAYLTRQGKFADEPHAPLPGLLLMDINTSGQTTGIDVLRQIRANPLLRHIIVILWTSTAPPSDINDAYAAGVNSFLLKPGDTRDLAELMRLVKAYWLERNQPPTGPRG